MTNKKEPGKAYCFFDCPASKREIETELPIARSYARTPSEMELLLTDDISALNPRGDKALRSIFQEARAARRKYAIEATLLEADNERTANELGDILNGLYMSPLYPQRGAFHREIVYEKDGDYLFKD